MRCMLCCGKFTKFLKNFFKFILIILFIIGMIYISWQFFKHNVDEPDRTELEEYEEKFFEWCKNTYEVCAEWVSETFEKCKNFVESLFASKEEIKFEGAKLNDIKSYEIGKYVNFTIPYTWTVGKIDASDMKTEECIIVSNETTMMTIELKDIDTPINVNALKWMRENMMSSLREMYPECTFSAGDVIKNKAAIINVESTSSNNTSYVAIIGLGEKTLVINYAFSNDNFIEAELYFMQALAEMVENI